MPIFKHSDPIPCAIEDAFEYVADWTNLKNFMPMFMDIKPVSLVQYGPGTSLETVLVLGKVEVMTTLDLTEFLKNKRILYKASRGIKSKISWDFASIGDKTLISFVFEYEIPPGLVNRDVEKEAIEKELSALAVQSMELLKWVLQSQSPGKNV
ncbi:MAG: SRPBCC family protein [Euryarchaeota archaeon]|nr:SRPBCC family protein [Euryarchaeota archaeon]